MKLLDRSLVAFSIAFAGALLAAGSAGAQPIYQCGNEYTRIPCPNGRVLDSSDTRTSAQRAEARRLLEDQHRQAAEMERDRRRNEAAIKPAAAGSLSARPPAVAPAASAPKKSKSKKKTRKPDAEGDDFVAGVPGSGKKKAPSP
jgi:hypothetical protein